MTSRICRRCTIVLPPLSKRQHSNLLAKEKILHTYITVSFGFCNDDLYKSFGRSSVLWEGTVSKRAISLSTCAVGYDCPLLLYHLPSKDHLCVDSLTVSMLPASQPPVRLSHRYPIFPSVVVATASRLCHFYSIRLPPKIKVLTIATASSLCPYDSDGPYPINHRQEVVVIAAAAEVVQYIRHPLEDADAAVSSAANG